MIIGSAVAGALLAGSFASALWRWLAYPVGFLGGAFGFGLGAALFEPIVLGGIIEAAAYSILTFLLSGGRDRADPTSSWIFAGIVAAGFLGMTYAAWKKNRR